MDESDADGSADGAQRQDVEQPDGCGTRAAHRASFQMRASSRSTANSSAVNVTVVIRVSPERGVCRTRRGAEVDCGPPPLHGPDRLSRRVLLSTDNGTVAQGGISSATYRLRWCNLSNTTDAGITEGAGKMSDVRGKTVRMDDDLWDALEVESRRSGVSEAEMLRRAALLYLAFTAAERRPEGVTLAAAFGALESLRLDR